jgi:hypothetical protein
MAVKQLLQGARKLSPYLMVEVLLPGGTLIALLLWLYQHYFRETRALAVRNRAAPS